MSIAGVVIDWFAGNRIPLGDSLLSGLLVAVVAWLVTRLERRLSGRSPQKEARP